MSLLKQFINFFIDLFKLKGLIFELARKDFKSRYLGSYLGLIWAFVNPVINILIVWFVFQYAFGARAVGKTPFIIWLIPAMILWYFFADCFGTGTNSIIEYNYLVKKVVFRVSVLPVVKIVSSLFVHLIFVLIFIIIFLSNGLSLNIYSLQVFYYLFATIILSLGLTWITSSIVIFFRDTSQIVNILLQIGFWATPIFWSLNRIPKKYHLIFKLNPVTYLSNGYRETFLSHTWFWVHWQWTIYFWVFTGIIFIAGALIFNRLRPHFADVL